MEVVWDVETSVTRTEEVNAKGKKTKRIDNSPFTGTNTLVSVGAAVRGYSRGWRSDYWFFYHDELPSEHDKVQAFQEVQSLLDKTTVFIAHNAKYDLQWLWASGFEYEGSVYDTMLGEYVWARGQKIYSLSLEESAKRRGVSEKKVNLTDQYWNKGVGFDSMPLEIVEEYGRQDCVTAGELYDSQQVLYYHKENYGLKRTLQMSNDFCVVLAHMEYSGVKIDQHALDAVEQEFIEERAKIVEYLEEKVKQLMGDTPINLSSPEQMSWVIFGRKPTDKSYWRETFIKDGSPVNRKMNKADFRNLLRNKCELIYKTKAKICQDCKGTGYIQKYKKDGQPYKKKNKCIACDTVGYRFVNTVDPAGLSFIPPDAGWISAGGFSTSKESLTYLASVARNRKMDDAVEFLESLIRLNAIDTYLDSFIGGIRRGIRNQVLHANFNQITTSTGRLSSSNPNLQNMPREGTFPVKRVFVSRFDGGKIVEGDFAQLEFRVAGELSGCEKVAQAIRDKVDVHSVTAKTLFEAADNNEWWADVDPARKKELRQKAKADTFKPLYGGTMGTPEQMVYYASFLQTYDGVAQWHERLQEEAIANKKVVLPTGREYAFPFAKRNYFGGATGATKIKNYPVQGYATADIVPMAVIHLHGLLNGLQSKLVNTVHDSIVVDAHPDEVDIVTKLMYKAMTEVKIRMQEFYDIELKMELGVEIKVGDNWMEGEEVHGLS